jgi:hypothetical protein
VEDRQLSKRAERARSEPKASGVRAPARTRAERARSEPKASGVRTPARTRAERARSLLGLAACALAIAPLGARGDPPPDPRAPEAPAAGAPGGAAAPAPEGAPPRGGAQPEDADLLQLHREAAESFYATDGDRDGFVAALEAMEMSAESFQAADRDRDGKLTLVEWVDARFEDAAPGAPQRPQ